MRGAWTVQARVIGAGLAGSEAAWQLARRGIKVELLEQNSLITETLGEHVCRSYVSGKRCEWDEYRTRVTDWELKRYMIVY